MKANPYEKITCNLAYYIRIDFFQIKINNNFLLSPTTFQSLYCKGPSLNFMRSDDFIFCSIENLTNVSRISNWKRKLVLEMIGIKIHYD